MQSRPNSLDGRLTRDMTSLTRLVLEPCSIQHPRLASINYREWSTSQSWKSAKPTSVSVAINELLNLNGSWSYSVEEVEDGCGNKVGYPSGISGSHGTLPQQQSVTVHHRPRVYLSGCDAQTFLKVAKGDSAS